MSSSFKAVVKKTKPATVAFLHVTGHYNQIPIALGRLYSWINEKGYVPKGPAITVYYNIPGEVPDDQLQWEVRSMLSGNVAESGPDKQGLGVKRVGAIQIATTMHKGPYEEVEKSYRALMVWVEENGYEINGPVEELYYNDPSKTPLQELLTEIRLPVRKQ